MLLILNMWRKIFICINIKVCMFWNIDVVLILNVRRLVIDVMVIDILFVFSMFFILFLIDVFDRDGVFVILDIRINMLLIFIVEKYILFYIIICR